MLSMPRTDLTMKNENINTRPAAVNIPFLRAVRSSFWLASSVVFTKNVPIILAIIPTAAMPIVTVTPARPKPAAHASTMVATIVPT